MKIKSKPANRYSESGRMAQIADESRVCVDVESPKFVVQEGIKGIAIRDVC